MRPTFIETVKVALRRNSGQAQFMWNLNFHITT